MVPNCYLSAFCQIFISIAYGRRIVLLASLEIYEPLCIAFAALNPVRNSKMLNLYSIKSDFIRKYDTNRGIPKYELPTYFKC